MWHEVHWNKLMRMWALYVGTEDGYIVGKLYSNKLSAKLSAKFHGYKFCKA